MRRHSLRFSRLGLRPSGRRRGAASVEFLLALPALALVTFAIFQFGLLMTVHQAISAAASVGAREAGQGAAAADVAAAVERVLSPHDVEINGAADSGTKVVVEDGAAYPAFDEFGDPAMVFTSGPSLAGNEVRVTVLVKLSAARVPNALAALGFDFGERTFRISSLVRKQ
jgi:Flp pilus assembly protein TadG